MTGRATQLLRDALELPTEERAAVATELIASLDDEGSSESIDSIETAWADEIARRARRVLSGDSAGTPWDEVHRNIEGNLERR